MTAVLYFVTVSGFLYLLCLKGEANNVLDRRVSCLVSGLQSRAWKIQYVYFSQVYALGKLFCMIRFVCVFDEDECS